MIDHTFRNLQSIVNDLNNKYSVKMNTEIQVCNEDEAYLLYSMILSTVCLTFNVKLINDNDTLYYYVGTLANNFAQLRNISAIANNTYSDDENDLNIRKIVRNFIVIAKYFSEIQDNESAAKIGRVVIDENYKFFIRFGRRKIEKNVWKVYAGDIFTESYTKALRGVNKIKKTDSKTAKK